MWKITLTFQNVTRTNCNAKVNAIEFHLITNQIYQCKVQRMGNSLNPENIKVAIGG